MSESMEYLEVFDLGRFSTSSFALHSIFNTSFSISPLKYQRSASGDMEKDVLNMSDPFFFKTAAQRKRNTNGEVENWPNLYSIHPFPYLCFRSSTVQADI